jgi:uncharacterized paraquat-inducible protein A
MPQVKETRGRCRQCRKIYQWLGAPKLHQAVCSRCHISLERCRTLDVGEKVFQSPTAAP